MIQEAKEGIGPIQNIEAAKKYAQIHLYEPNRQNAISHIKEYEKLFTSCSNMSECPDKWIRFSKIFSDISKYLLKAENNFFTYECKEETKIESCYKMDINNLIMNDSKLFQRQE